MPTPTTLTAYWTDETGRLGIALAAAKAQLTLTQAAELVANTAYAASAKLLQQSRDRVDAARKALAGIPMPADGDPLLAEMRDALVDWRNAAAEHAANEGDHRRLGERRLLETAKVSSLTSRLADAKTAQTANQTAATQRGAWLAAVDIAPLSDLPTTAQTALTDFEAGAKAKVEADFPSNTTAARDFLKRVRARAALADTVRGNASTLATSSQAIQTSWIEASTRNADKLPKLQAAFDHAVTALQGFAVAAPLVTQASDALAALAALTDSALSSAQRAELISADTTLTDAREDGLELLLVRDQKQAALASADLAYQTALFTAQVAAPDKTEVQLRAADAALQGKFDTLGTAIDELDDAEAGLAGSLAVLETWFAAVPDVLWDRLDKLDGAITSLTAIKNTVIATLKSNLQAAETALAGALDAASLEQRKVDTIKDGLARRNSESAVAGEVALRRRQSAARFVALV